MMGPVGQDGAMVRGGPERPDGPGKKMQSVGQKAKMAVAMAQEAGGMLPKNAQGVAASGLARGADAEALFASVVAPEPVDPPPAETELDAKSLAVAVQDLPSDIES